MVVRSAILAWCPVFPSQVFITELCWNVPWFQGGGRGWSTPWSQHCSAHELLNVTGAGSGSPSARHFTGRSVSVLSESIICRKYTHWV